MRTCRWTSSTSHYLDTSGARALLYFIDHSEKDGVAVKHQADPPRLESQLTALADNEQRDKLRTVLESA
ncbi:hypothetical protein M4D79_13520 [Mycolicibacterium novocastrense]|nr:hypothetical protein M4D79_13520 [Mycolicibacterium novocastrense]